MQSYGRVTTTDRSGRGIIVVTYCQSELRVTAVAPRWTGNMHTLLDPEAAAPSP